MDKDMMLCERDVLGEGENSKEFGDGAGGYV